MDKKAFQKKYPLQTMFLGIIIVIVLMIIVFDTLNTPKQNNGTVTLYVPLAGTDVYIDGNKKAVTERPNETIVIDKIKTGTHFVLTNKDGYWPWKKDFDMITGADMVAASFTMKQLPIYSLVPEYELNKKGKVQNDTYQNILAQFDKIATKKISGDNTISIEIQNENIIATWLNDKTQPSDFFCQNDSCDTTFQVLQTQRQLRQVDFYPDRDDLIIFSSEDKIWAIELDKNGIQNAQPIYMGLKPNFIRGIGNSIYVKDGMSLMLINL